MVGLHLTSNPLLLVRGHSGVSTSSYCLLGVPFSDRCDSSIFLRVESCVRAFYAQLYTIFGRLNELQASGYDIESSV